MGMVPDDDNFTTFINARPTKMAKDMTLLQWWSSPARRTTFRALSSLEIDVFTAFSQLAVSEGTFSGTRQTIPWERATLGGEVVEQTKCCHNWQVSGLAYDDRFTVADSSDDYDSQTQSEWQASSC